MEIIQRTVFAIFIIFFLSGCIPGGSSYYRRPGDEITTSYSSVYSYSSAPVSPLDIGAGIIYKIMRSLEIKLDTVNGPINIISSDRSATIYSEVGGGGMRFSQNTTSDLPLYSKTTQPTNPNFNYSTYGYEDFYYQNLEYPY